MKSGKTIVEEYLKKNDWRVSENSNAIYSIGALGKHMTGEVSKDYWLNTVYPDYIRDAYLKGEIHIHDLGGLTLYCTGYSLRVILLKGVRGIQNIPTSVPAKHFFSALNQIANLTTVFQNEIMGAVAYNGFDTLLAPFIKEDKLTYKEVKQYMQNFIFSINSNSRGGSEPAFSNLTFDITPPEDIINTPVIVRGEFLDYTYRDCQEEMNMINRAFCEIMYKGDATGRLFSYPIPTYNIHKRFDWDNPNNNILWELAGKYGTPYFANFINSDLDISDIRSMCCRLAIRVDELKKRNGGLFGSGDSTGSIGVCTINLPRIGYVNKTEPELMENLDRVLDIAKDSLIIKRKWIKENVIDGNLVPAFNEYVGTIDNHFNTIGVIGMNEMCLNFLGVPITDPKARDFALKIGDHIRQKLLQFQVETGALFNYEATPAEGCSYSLALKDKKSFPDIITQGEGKDIYYTNSCHIPVKDISSIDETFKHQEPLQQQFTGGTVIHIYLEGAISGIQAKNIIKSVCENYKVPYVSLSPISRYCSEHGYEEKVTETCSKCGKKLQMYQRITGYLRCVDNFNIGKKQEFKERKQLKIENKADSL